jgi:hypothetical protein
VAYNSQTENNKIRLLMEYESVTRKVLFGNAVLAALMSGRIYDVMPRNGVLWFFETKSVIKMHKPQYGKDSPSDNAVRR